jgi:hypothetical protein
MDLDLQTWLTEQAGLSGSKLKLAVDACNEGAVDSIEDLLELYENDLETFKEVFSQGMIRSKVKIALDRDKDNIKAQDNYISHEKVSLKAPTQTKAPISKVPVSSLSAAISQSQSSTTKGIDQPAFQLPPGKLYHFFASHKV